MRHADVRHDGDVRLCDFCNARHLTGHADAHFDNGGFVLRRDAQNGHGQANLAARDTDNRDIEALAIAFRDLLQCRAGVFNVDNIACGGIERLFGKSRCRARCEDLRDKAVCIGVFAADGHKHFAGRRLAAVGIKRRNDIFAVADEPAAAHFGDLRYL